MKIEISANNFCPDNCPRFEIHPMAERQCAHKNLCKFAVEQYKAKMNEKTESKRIDTLKKVSRMIAEGKIPNEVYDEYLSDTPLGFRTADGVLEYLLYGG